MYHNIYQTINCVTISNNKLFNILCKLELLHKYMSILYINCLQYCSDIAQYISKLYVYTYCTSSYKLYILPILYNIVQYCLIYASIVRSLHKLLQIVHIANIAQNCTKLFHIYQNCSVHIYQYCLIISASSCCFNACCFNASILPVPLTVLLCCEIVRTLI